MSYSTVPKLRSVSTAPTLRSSVPIGTLSWDTTPVQPADAFLAGPVGQPGQQFGAQPPALPVVGDGEGDLGGLRVVGVPDVAGEARAAPVGRVQRDERLVVVMIHVGVVTQLGR